MRYNVSGSNINREVQVTRVELNPIFIQVNGFNKNSYLRLKLSMARFCMKYIKNNTPHLYGDRKYSIINI